MTGAVKRGALIVFEGCDRSGKTTQVEHQDKFYPHTQSSECPSSNPTWLTRLTTYILHVKQKDFINFYKNVR